MKDIIGTTKYFVHKGTWENGYEWRIQKVKVTGLKIEQNNKMYAEFSFSCVGYEYPVSYLKDTLIEAKKFAIAEITAEKERQIKQINNIKRTIK